MVTRALVIQHSPWDGLGTIAEVLKERGFVLEVVLVVPGWAYRAPGVSCTFPGDPRRYDAVVAGGADWSVGQREITPWLIPELMFLRAAHDARVPVFGACFGAQALTAALPGGIVRKARHPEVGWTVLNHHAGLGHEIFGPGKVMEWHHDEFILPWAAQMALAHTGLGGQAWIAGRSWAVQWHPEIRVPQVLGWIDHGGRDELAALRIDPDALLAETREHEARNEAQCRALIGRWLDDDLPWYLRPPVRRVETEYDRWN
jgi:GMP synthase-like glutamine amidotransferase